MARARRIASLPEPHFWGLTPAEVERIIREAIDERMAFESPADQRNAMLCALLANCNRDPKSHPKPFTAEEFMLRRVPVPEPRPAETASKAVNTMKALTTMNRALKKD